MFCVEAKNSGQDTIPFAIFPSELDDVRFMELQKDYENDIEKTGLWTDLKKGYDFFNEKKQLPSINFLNSGRHEVR